MEVASEMVELLTSLTRESYNPDSFQQRLQTVLSEIDVSLQRGSQLSVHGYEVTPGHRDKKTGIMLSGSEGPDSPSYSRRPSRSGLSYYRDLVRETTYDAVLGIGPHTIEYGTANDGHRYLTSEVDGEISSTPHLDYLTEDSCSELLSQFFNPQITTDTWETQQRSFEDF